MSAKIIEMPSVADIPKGLRELADSIEAGNYGDAHSLAWVCDCGDGEIAVGLLGNTSEVGAVAYFLLGLGMREMEQGGSYE